MVRPARWLGEEGLREKGVFGKKRVEAYYTPRAKAWEEKKPKNSAPALAFFPLDNAGNAARLVDQRRAGHAISKGSRLVSWGELHLR
jgi:hypothetical protein